MLIRNESEIAPRTRRFMRELVDAGVERDPEVHFWKRVSAVVTSLSMASLVMLLVLAGVFAPAPDVAVGIVDSVASHADAQTH